MTRRKRVDTADGEKEIMKDALSGAPKPPKGVKISKDVMPFWELVTTAKAKRAWTGNDLVLAADVARCMYRLEKISEQLETYLCYSLLTDDMQQEGKKEGVPETKEMEKLADTLSKRIKMLSTHLQIHTEATQGKSREQVKQNQAHREARDFAEPQGGIDKDDLISRPTH